MATWGGERDKGEEREKKDEKKDGEDTYIYRMSRKFLPSAFVYIEQNKLIEKSSTILSFSQRTEILLKIVENWSSIIFYSNVNFTEKQWDKNCLFSSHKVLRIFSEFFNIAFFHVDKNKKMLY